MKSKPKLENPDFAKVSSKGQLVIPHELREKMHIDQGSVFTVTNPLEDMIVLKKVEGKITEEELETLRGIKEAWDQIERGEYGYAKNIEDFKKEFKKW